MKHLEHDIKPGVGLGEILLGTLETAVAERLGEPDELREPAKIVRVHVWESLSLTFFDGHDGFRLGQITTSSPSSTLLGASIVGMTEAELLGADFGELGPPALDDEFTSLPFVGDDDGELKDYIWKSASLSCYVAGGRVDSVTIMPLYDESGRFPLWPDGVA